MRPLLIAVGGSVVLASCLAPDVEIVSSLGSGGLGVGGLGVGGLGVGGFNAGGAMSSGGVAGTSNPVTCPGMLPPQLSQFNFPCTQQGLACDYGATHCVCDSLFFDCSTSSSGGTGGASNGGSAGSSAGTSGSAGSNAGTAGSGGGFTTSCASYDATDSHLGGGLMHMEGASLWEGYASPRLLGAGSVEPANFDALPTSDAPCVCGEVGLDDQAYAGIVVNLSQPNVGSTPGTIVPSNQGIYYQLTSFTPGMRVQLDGPQGSWCAEIASMSGTVLWEEFFECYTGSPQYNFDFITSIAFVLPGSVLQEQSFDFCLLQVVEQ